MTATYTFEAAAPVTALLIAPNAELWIIPLLRTEEGLRPGEPLLVAGDNCGIALILLLSGIACVIFAAIAMRSPQYRMLSRQYSGTTDQACIDEGKPTARATTSDRSVAHREVAS